MRLNGDNSRPLRTAENDILYFLHIPKTAGTSVTKWFSKALDQRLICPAKNWDQLVMTDPQALGRYRFFSGHFGMDLGPFLERNVTAMTLLRDPLRRTISHYRHVRRDHEHPLHNRVAAQSFEMFVMDRQNWPMIENFQARYLVSTPILFKKYVPLYDENLAKRNRLSVLSEDARYLLDPTYVREKALEATLARLAIVGTDECLADFLHHIAGRLGCGAFFFEVPRENVAPADNLDEFSSLSLEMVEELTAIDREIYARVAS
jgi:sulfotransferase famil protein